METTIRTVTATSTRIARTCPSPPTSTGSIYAESCGPGVERTSAVFLLTTNEVASVSIAGGERVPTATNPTLPDGLRAAALQGPSGELKPALAEPCPSVTAFDASGAALSTQGSVGGTPLASRLDSTAWEHPGHPPSGPCELRATQLRRGTVAWGGKVARRVAPVRRLLGRAFLSCDDTLYVHGGGEYITAAILLDAAHPGTTPAPLPGMRPLAKHPGIFLAPSSERMMMVARRIPHAWLVATEETPEGLAGPRALLEHLRARIEL
jgi:hypothetical protein